MKGLYRTGADDTPLVNFDPEKGQFEISGRSLPENATVFYEPIIDWLSDYSEKPNAKTILDIRLNYFNTASSKLLLDILLVLEEMKENGHEVLVRWHYHEEDEDMAEAGEEYEDIVELEFEHIAFQ